MNILEQGQYFGRHYQKTSLNGLILTDTEYTHDYVDWHYHENPYFTFILQGKVVEENRKETYCLSQGSLVFHHWQDPHRNIKPPGYTRGFHLEIETSWFERYGLRPDQLEGSIPIQDPVVKNTLTRILLESKIRDPYNRTSVQMLVLELCTGLAPKTTPDNRPPTPPAWTKRLEALIRDSTDLEWTIEAISRTVGVHPVHLSRSFHKYYGTSFGQYCRNLKLDKAVSLLLANKHSLTEIAYQSQFYDQSHFTACFKKRFGCTPRQFKKTMG